MEFKFLMKYLIITGAICTILNFILSLIRVKIEYEKKKNN